MKVILDVDGVLAHFVGGVLPILQHYVPNIVSADDVTEYDVLSLVPDSHREAYISDVLDSIRYNGFCDYIKPYPGAARFLAMLSSMAEVVIATSPYKYDDGSVVGAWVEDRDDWLRRNFIRLPVVYTGHKHLLAGDVLVDDSVKNCGRWTGTGRVALLFDRPWNRSGDPNTAVNWKRVSGYEEVLSYVESRT